MRLPNSARAAASAAALLTVVPHTGQADPAASAQPNAPAPPAPQTLLGDAFGLRPALGSVGVTLGLTEMDELLANPVGGRLQTADFDGLTTVNLQADTAKLLGLQGGQINVSALHYHGRNLSTDALLTDQTASGIEAERGARLWELWYQQKISDALDIRIGQQSIDQEFNISANSALFVGTSFGFPYLGAFDLPGGGPAYPLSALGVRVHGVLSPSVTLIGGVFNGSPSHRGCSADPLRCDPSGTSFPLDGGQLIIGEVQVTTPDGVLPSGSYKLGFYVDTYGFPDLRLDNHGIPLASPFSDQIPRAHRATWSIYGVADQTIWSSGRRQLNAFFRASGAPADENPVGFCLTGGLVLKSPFAARPGDSAGLAVAYGKVSASLRGYALDQQSFGADIRAPSDETQVEATYQYQARDWLVIQPVAQYVFNPGSGVDVLDPARRVRNELVLGLRSNINF